MTGGDPRDVRRARRALFTDPSELGADPVPASGGSGEPSMADLPGRGDDVAGPAVRIECSQCGAVTRRPLLETVGASLRPFAWWMPVKRHSRWLTCTACGSKAWCRVEWLAALGQDTEEPTGDH